MMSTPSRFAVGDRVIPRWVDSPAVGVVIEVRAPHTYLVEWQTDYLTELVAADEIAAAPEE